MQSVGLGLVGLCALASICSAQFVPGVTTTSGLGTFGTYNILNLTNGVGLSSLTVTATHSTSWQQMWIGNTGVTTGALQFDLGSVLPLSAIAVWNYNDATISVQRGVALMDVSTSLDAINWTPLSTESPPIGTGQPMPPHLIQANGATARYVRFDILQNYGNNYTGLAEVQFVAGAGVNVATNATLGDGCIRARTSFYELFATSAAFDLANSGLTMIPSGGGYLVLPGSAGYVAPSAAATTLALANNAQTSVTLAAPFPYPGGSTTSLSVCANGYVAVAAGNTTSGTPTAATMLAAPQTAWWNWHDYNPQAAGSGQVKFEQVGPVAFVTWDGVFDNGGTTPASASTFQFQLDTASGIVHLVFQATSTGGNARLVGYSPGGASADPGNTDLSAALPLTFTTAANDVQPLVLAGVSRPVIGTTWSLNVSNVPAAGTIGIDVFGVADAGILDLGFLGAPGCGARASLELLNAWVVAGPTHGYSLALPNDPTLVSLHVFTQGVVLQPGVNTLLGGVITSNGIDGRIGDL
jgi:hypothetical protein